MTEKEPATKSATARPLAVLDTFDAKNRRQYVAAISRRAKLGCCGVLRQWALLK